MNNFYGTIKYLRLFTAFILCKQIRRETLKKKLFIASCYRQLSADSKSKNYINFPRGRRTWLTKLIDFMIFILIFVNARHDIIISVWLRTSYNPVDIKRFRSQTGKSIFEIHVIYVSMDSNQVVTIQTYKPCKI